MTGRAKALPVMRRSGHKPGWKVETVMKNLGKHLIWLSKRLDAVIRTIFEKDGKLWIKYEGTFHEVIKDGDSYIAEM